jgi:DNA gyrase subunit A
MAKYHPHGDSAIYDTLVRMAQEFSLRYPLVHGQGNFGSVDGDSAAAMRYTEAKMSAIAEELLVDIEKETVDWMPNYDATREEPKVFPAKLPNLLLNGSVGIAVGMATNIPTHNLNEIADAVLYLADNADATTEDLLRFVKGPDFPTGGIIYDAKAIREAYVSGRGAILTRAKAEIVEKKNSRQFDIVVTEIPYQTNKSELIKTIAELAQDKKIEGIRDLRDESDREGMRIVIELKNDVAPQRVLNWLYKHTDLEKNFNLNMIALVEGGLVPRLLTLKDILAEYLAHRKEIVKRRTQFDLRKAQERAHILEGLAKALDAIDRVIATIKKSKDKEDAHVNLVKGFKFSDLQATAILEMRLQTLAALEHQKIDAELKEKRALIEELTLILKSPAKILKIIKDEVAALKEK